MRSSRRKEMRARFSRHNITTSTDPRGISEKQQKKAFYYLIGEQARAKASADESRKKQ